MSTPALDSTPVVLGGRYELEQPVGQGGSGQVYRALDHALHRHVAVKMLHDSEASAKRSARFKREISLQAELAHPNLIPVLDTGTESARRYLVMPLIHGTTLANRIAAGPLATRETQRAAAALAGALDCVHSHGVVHRDVNPSNVLLGRDGQVFLADFGIACLRSEPDSTTTGHFSLTGTAAYMAPEQVEHGTTDYPGDIYALGLVLLEALTGVRAYQGTLLEQALARLWRQPEIPASLGPGWSGLLAEMTARDPACRPTPRHIIEALGAVGSPPPSTPNHHSHWARPLRRRPHRHAPGGNLPHAS